MIRVSLFALALAMASPAFAQTQAAQPIIDGPALAGAPPAAGSPRDAADRLAMKPAVSAERLAQARTDQAFNAWAMFQPVLGEGFTRTQLPRTAAAIAATMQGVGPTINAAKDAHPRTRPFADRSVIQCDDPGQNTAGSYPSGHGAGGWALALVLAELIPSRADAILQRGRDFGESRIICGYHFPSDIEASRLVAAGAVARLHGDAEYRRALDAARRELARTYPE
ncbi:nonspecific acid phosphatase precursor [alpha proteobacterium U9-1i]|nr:nonspecific acid phosphatase precursor [alpha proteobacterium U9-1i]